MNDESVNQEFNEDQATRYYFTRGFSYHEILLFLEKQHSHVISYSTLLRLLNQLGLHRRQKNVDHTHFTRAYQRIEDIVNGPGSNGGYRAVWHTLKMEGTQVPQRFVECSLKEIDPFGCKLHRKHGIKRMQHIKSGPNFQWHYTCLSKNRRYCQWTRLQRWISSSLAYTKDGRNSGSSKICRVFFERNRSVWMQASPKAWY